MKKFLSAFLLAIGTLLSIQTAECKIGLSLEEITRISTRVINEMPNATFAAKANRLNEEIKKAEEALNNAPAASEDGLLKKFYKNNKKVVIGLSLGAIATVIAATTYCAIQHGCTFPWSSSIIPTNAQPIISSRVIPITLGQSTRVVTPTPATTATVTPTTATTTTASTETLTLNPEAKTWEDSCRQYIKPEWCDPFFRPASKVQTTPVTTTTVLPTPATATPATSTTATPTTVPSTPVTPTTIPPTPAMTYKPTGIASYDSANGIPTRVHPYSPLTSKPVPTPLDTCPETSATVTPTTATTTPAPTETLTANPEAKTWGDSCRQYIKPEWCDRIHNIFSSSSKVQPTPVPSTPVTTTPKPGPLDTCPMPKPQIGNLPTPSSGFNLAGQAQGTTPFIPANTPNSQALVVVPQQPTSTPSCQYNTCTQFQAGQTSQPTHEVPTTLWQKKSQPADGSVIAALKNQPLVAPRTTTTPSISGGDNPTAKPITIPMNNPNTILPETPATATEPRLQIDRLPTPASGFNIVGQAKAEGSCPAPGSGNLPEIRPAGTSEYCTATLCQRYKPAPGTTTSAAAQVVTVAPNHQTCPVPSQMQNVTPGR